MSLLDKTDTLSIKYPKSAEFYISKSTISQQIKINYDNLRALYPYKVYEQNIS